MTERWSAAGIARDITGGVVASFLALAYCFSYAALIFDGPLSQYLSFGVSAALIACAVVAIFVALFSRFSLVVASPIAHTAAPVAGVMAALAPAFAAHPDQVLPLALAALLVTTILTAVSLFALGQARLGMLVRFVPYPVVTGFLSATGWLVAIGALRIAAHGELDLFAPAWPGSAITATLVLTVVLAAVLMFVSIRIKHFLALPVVLFAAGLGAHAGLAWWEISGVDARASGFLFDPGGSGSMSTAFAGRFLPDVDWTLLVRAAPEMAAVAVMAILSVLLNSAGMEAIEQTDAKLDHELKVHGVANALSGVLGGMISHLSLSLTTMAREAGARSRLTGVVTGLCALIVLVVGTQGLGQVPVFLLCGLLLQAGVKLLWDWLWLSRRQLPLRDWLIIIAIVAVTATFGFVQGVFIGIVASCIIFALDVSRIGVVRREYGLNERPSMVVRSEAETSVVVAHGADIHVLELGGFIFFGSAYWLQDHVMRLVEAKKPTTIVFDFSACTGVDSSAAATLAQLRAKLGKAGVRQIFTGMPSGIDTSLKLAHGSTTPPTFSDLDHALEACEEGLIEKHAPDSVANRQLIEWLTAALGGTGNARALAARLKPAATEGETHLCHQGGPSDSLFFIEEGRIGVFVERKGHKPLRVRVFAPHTIAGEIGFFLHTPRTATMRAAEGAKVWLLDRTAFEDLRNHAPEAAAALLTYTVRLQAERLAFATRQIAALQRN